MPSVLSILLASYFGGTVVSESVDALACGLRVYAAALLVHVIDHFAECYPTLKSRVVATLLQALLAHMDDGTATTVETAAGSCDAKLGALIGLRRLGPSSFKTLAGQVGVHVDGDDNAAPVERIPLRVMAEWLPKLAEHDETKHLYERMVHELHAGFQKLAVNVAPHDASASAEAVRETYGALWPELFSNEPQVLAALAELRTFL